LPQTPAKPRPPSRPVRLPQGRRLDIDNLVRVLAEDGLISAADAARARVAGGGKQTVDVHPLVMLANLKLVNPKHPGSVLSLEQLTEWLAHASGVPYLRIDPTKIDLPAVTGLISHAYVQRFRILPVEVDTQRVVFATSEPTDTRWITDIQHVLRREIELRVSNPLDVHRYTMEFFGVTRSVRRAKDAGEDSVGTSGMPSFEQLVELGKAGEVGADDRHIVHIVDWLLQYAYEQRASDIHLEPRRDMSRVRFRIDGVLHKVFELPTPVMIAVTSRIKVLGRMDVAEKRRPQDGRIKTRSPGGREVEMRLSTMPTAFGEKCVMRIFDPDTALKDIEALGFSSTEATMWNALVQRPHGIVLVTGPTGSGKTTTLYSTLKRLATADVNVCTVEDPIEMIAPEFNQMQVHQAIDLDFASGVRTLLRQDPDIIMIGEIRDLETAQMAVQASLTGHLVLSTLHTNDACSALTRLLDLGVPHYLIQSTVNGVLAQRLVRTLCPHCKVEAVPDPERWYLLVDRYSLAVPERIAAPKGCLECRNTGFMGRIGLYEMLTLTPMLRSLIQAQMDLGEFTRAAEAEGLRTLRCAAAAHVAAGRTTIEEAMTVLPPVE
jgi:general secretion pathway protein E